LAVVQKEKIKNSSSTLNKILIVCSIAFIGLLGYQWWINGDAKFVRYKEFGIDIPVNYTIHGIDVSHHNGIINWDEVKKMNIRGITISFAFIKATQGSSNSDNQFARNWLQAKKYGVVRGAYHYYNELKTAKEQADNFIKTVGDILPGDLPPVLDIEENNGTPKELLCKGALEWLRLIEAHYKVKPILYTYVNFYEKNLNADFDTYTLWAAHYNEKHQPRISRNWLIWQHNDNGRVNGIEDAVDFNVFNGDLFTFKKMLVR
jgi:lysozyme